uniref:Uncharacterized protein n=1 Tax=Arundo donax TaxID=35708 RepID=A0A0A8XRU0_ARUDO
MLQRSSETNLKRVCSSCGMSKSRCWCWCICGIFPPFFLLFFILFFSFSN